MEDGLVSPVDEGTPQGGPLSPLLSNLVLDELDRELERRGHHFVRYADDSNIYVGSERAGQRVWRALLASSRTVSSSRSTRRRAPWLDRGKGSFSDSASRGNENRGGGSLPRLSLASRSGFGSRRGEPAASACGRWSRNWRPISVAGSGTSATVKRPRCWNVLRRGYAADFGRWCESNGSVDGQGSASCANGASVRTSRRKRPGALTVPGGSRTRPP